MKRVVVALMAIGFLAGLNGCATMSELSKELGADMNRRFTGVFKASDARKEAEKKLRGNGKAHRYSKEDIKLVISSDYEKVGDAAILEAGRTTHKTTLYAIPAEGKLVIVRVFAIDSHYFWNQEQQWQIKIKTLESTRGTPMEARHIYDENVARWVSPFARKGWYSTIQKSDFDEIVVNTTESKESKMLIDFGIAYNEIIVDAHGKYGIHLTYVELGMAEAIQAMRILNDTKGNPSGYKIKKVFDADEKKINMFLEEMVSMLSEDKVDSKGSPNEYMANKMKLLKYDLHFSKKKVMNDLAKRAEKSAAFCSYFWVLDL